MSNNSNNNGNDKDLMVRRVGSAPSDDQQKNNKIMLGMPASGNKALYLIVVEDPSSESKFITYGTAKPDKTIGFVEFIGYDLSKATRIETLKTYEDVTELGFRGEAELVSICIPSTRVVSIRNVSYKTKSA